MPKNKDLKRQEAEERQSKRNKRSHKDQIASLDAIFGKDLGAKKERTRLLSIINKKEEKTEEEGKEKPKKRKKKKDE